MPNTFGGYPLIDPGYVIENRHRFRRETLPELMRANSYYSMSGRWPDVGWLLLDRGSFSKLSTYSSTLQLVIQDFVNSALTISNLSIVQARCVTRGLASDPNAIYLIQVTNSIGVLYNPWFQMAVNAQYNVRVPAYDGKFYDHSMNAGVPWTWDTMVGDLWSKAPAQLGTYPHLPITPTSVPENFTFNGVCLWDSLKLIMDHLGLTINGSYPSLTILVAGAADDSFTAQQAQYASSLKDDMEYLDGGSGRVPGQVVVFFRRRNQFYGQEETVRYDSPQWLANQAYSVTVSAPSQFSTATGTAYIWSSFSVRYDENSVPLAADTATAALVAQERVTELFNTIFRGTQGSMRQLYGGIIPFTTGSLVDGVRWYNLPEDRDTNQYGGWHTEIVRGYIWEEAMFSPTFQGQSGLD